MSNVLFKLLCPQAEEADFPDLADFLADWQDASDTILVHTSGSTGTPKPLWVEKRRMEESARMTCDFLGLQPGDTALLCMSLKYIAGKMMVVRSLVRRLHLIAVPPSGHPLAGLTEAPTFAAMIPMQVYNSLRIPEERRMLEQIPYIIIGGGAVDGRLAEELAALPGEVWSTYGMTETLSHIAMRRLNGQHASDWYTPLPEVQVSLSEENTLVVHAPRVCAGTLTTNDLAELDDCGRFRILGRRDNIINSGGVKIQMEQVEEALRPYMNQPYLVTATPDRKFGEVVVLLLEGGEPDGLAALLADVLPVYQRPRHILSVERLPQTETGKPDRAAARRFALAAQ